MKGYQEERERQCTQFTKSPIINGAFVVQKATFRTLIIRQRKGQCWLVNRLIMNLLKNGQNNQSIYSAKKLPDRVQSFNSGDTAMAGVFIAKPTVPDLVKGKRLNIGPLTCTGKTHYIRQSWHREGEAIYYRHVFRSANGDCFVYTGNPLGVAVGEEIYLRCTIKRVDNTWNCVRIMRPVIVLVVDEPALI